MRIRNGVCYLFLAGVVFATTNTLSAEPPRTDSQAWSSFQNGGQDAETGGATVVRWSEDSNVAWTAEIEGYGQSTPIVADGLVYVTSVSGPMKDRFHLAAFALASGKQLWTVAFDNPSPKENTPMTSRAAPSPVADSDGCVAFFEGGIVSALGRDGKVQWQRDLVGEFGAISARHGIASSIEHDSERIYLWVERSDDPYVLALDRVTGETIWKVAGAGSTTWASPRLISTSWGDHLVCSASGILIGLDPKSGERLWQFNEISGNTSCTPFPAGENCFLIGASDGRGEATAGSGAASNGVVQISKMDDGFHADFRWRAEKASSTFGSPIVAGDSVFIVNRTGVLYRLDLETGERVSTTRLEAGGIWATPIACDGHLYLFGYRGTTSVVSLEDGKEVATNRLWDAVKEESMSRGGHVLYAAAPADPFLLIRRGDRLYALADADRPSKADADPSSEPTAAE